MTEEVWKPIECYGGIYKGKYEVSNLGRVRSTHRVIRRNSFYVQVGGKILNKNISCRGYPYVTLCLNGRSRTRHIHYLVASAFIPNPENKPYVDHINTDKTDYSLSNLRWVTAKENSNNPLTLVKVRQCSHSPEALKKSLNSRKRKNGKTAPKLVYQFTLKGEYITQYESAREAERRLGIKSSEIMYNCKGKRISAGGYLWSITPQAPEYAPYKVKWKKIAQYTKEGIFIKEWPSIKEAAITLDLLQGNIWRSVKAEFGKKSCGGYLWKYV